MVIIKYEITNKISQSFLMHEGSIVLNVIFNRGIYLHVLSDPLVKRKRRFFELYETGAEVPIEPNIERNFIGTIIENPFIWHIFEKVRIK